MGKGLPMVKQLRGEARPFVSSKIHHGLIAVTEKRLQHREILSGDRPRVRVPIEKDHLPAAIQPASQISIRQRELSKIVQINLN